MPDDTTRGAMPRPGAIPGQAGQAAAGPISWPRVLRDVEGSQSGANGGDPRGAPAGAAPSQPPGGATPPAQTPATPPAIGADGALGEAGKRALDAERTRADTAEGKVKSLETRIAELETATQTDQEKALGEAKRTASAEERTKWTGHIRLTEVRGALSRAGLTDEKALALAAGAPEFGKLKVTDEGQVERLTETVEAFKKDYPLLFAAPAAPPRGGAWDGAAGGSGKGQPATLEDAVGDRLASQTRR